MTCREKFVMEHPDVDLERNMLETCPQDHGIQAKGKMACMEDPYWQDCRGCWEREAEE